MPNTASGLPYPVGTDVPDVPAHIKALADALEIHAQAQKVLRTTQTGNMAVNGQYSVVWESAAAAGAFGSHGILPWDAGGITIPINGFYLVQLQVAVLPSAASRCQVGITDNGVYIGGLATVQTLSTGNTHSPNVAGMPYLVSGHKISGLVFCYGAIFPVVSAALSVVGPII